MNIKSKTYCLASLVLVAGSGCNTAGGNADGAKQGKAFDGDYPYRVVTTCGMVTDIVGVVGGDKADVVGLLGEGVDPHSYRATRGDISELLKADIVFYSGLMLEGQMGDEFIKISRRGTLVYPVTEEIDKKFLREPPEFLGHWDPHVWMDVMAWSECVKVVAKALSEFDPPNKDEYKENSEKYTAELKKLDVYVREVINSIPTDRKVLITAHDAFGYFSRAYDIEVLSVLGLSTETGAGVAKINDIVSFIVDQKIQAIFVETSVNPKNIEALIAGAADRGWTVKIGGHLFSDAMGKPRTYEGTYIGMIDHNATTIARALGGKAPKRGLNGKLAAARHE